MNDGCFKPTCAAGTRRRTLHVRVLGPSLSGKSALIRFLLEGHAVDTNPTDETEVTKVIWRDRPIIFWDGRRFGDKADSKQPKLINLSPKECSSIAARQPFDAIIYVVDAADAGRFRVAARDLAEAMTCYHNVDVVLILGTKEDLLFAKGTGGSTPEATLANIRNRLDIHHTCIDRQHETFLITLASRQTVDAALDWMVARVIAAGRSSAFKSFTKCCYC